MSNFSAQYLLREILQFADYTLARVSDETGISRTTLARIYHDCYSMVQLRNFNKLFRLYCRLVSAKRFYG